jgi:hypothetical protein
VTTGATRTGRRRRNGNYRLDFLRRSRFRRGRNDARDRRQE